MTPGASREFTACFRQPSSKVLRMASVPMTVIGFVLRIGRRQNRRGFAGADEFVWHDESFERRAAGRQPSEHSRDEE